MSGLPPRKIPRMSHHRASGQAVVRLNGRDCYLGPWGSQTATREYDGLIAEWLATGRQATTGSHFMVNQLIVTFWDYASEYYRHADGTPTNEIRNYREALKHLRRLYGHTEAADFGGPGAQGGPPEHDRGWTVPDQHQPPHRPSQACFQMGGGEALKNPGFIVDLAKWICVLMAWLMLTVPCLGSVAAAEGAPGQLLTSSIL